MALMFRFMKKAIFLGGATALLVAVFVGGVYLGYSNRPAIQKITVLFNKETAGKPAQVDFSPFWAGWNVVQSKYVGRSNLDYQKMVWGAIEGMVGALDDPYSVFFPPKEAEIFETGVKGEFGGVGIEIDIRDKMLTVITPLKNTPAYNAGIKAGDKILKINTVSTQGMTLDEAVFLIRGIKGTEVALTILSEGEEEPREVKLIRDTIQIPILDTEKKENGIFVIKLYNFSQNSPEIFKNALREMIVSENYKLILDLRGNAGGYLEASVDIASWFLPIGKVVAREDFGNGKETIFRSRGYDVFKNLPFVILINQGSASASEILAGALQEHKIATLVGEKSFGKGSVQELVPITDNTSLKITIARWLTPNGKSISENGLDPDIEIKMTKEDALANRDPQMEKAVEILNNINTQVVRL
jgi:carboxyl-terminal processing protease